MSEVRARAGYLDYGRDVEIQIAQIDGAGMDSTYRPLVFQSDGVLTYAPEVKPLPAHEGVVTATLKLPTDIAEQLYAALHDLFGRKAQQDSAALTDRLIEALIKVASR